MDQPIHDDFISVCPEKKKSSNKVRYCKTVNDLILKAVLMREVRKDSLFLSFFRFSQEKPFCKRKEKY